MKYTAIPKLVLTICYLATKSENSHLENMFNALNLMMFF